MRLVRSRSDCAIDMEERSLTLEIEDRAFVVLSLVGDEAIVTACADRGLQEGVDLVGLWVDCLSVSKLRAGLERQYCLPTDLLREEEYLPGRSSCRRWRRAWRRCRRSGRRCFHS